MSNKTYKKPIVSICCLTFNHAKSIRQCLCGFLMQKTDFKYEILIHDDASTDGTDKIIQEFTLKYPEIIKPLYEEQNQYTKGISISKTFNFPRIKGKYVAMCEGDDYWTDPYKLQKQVDFLENNPEYTICFHKVQRIYESVNRKSDILPSFEMLNRVKSFDYSNLLKNNFIQTCSVLYRWDSGKNLVLKMNDSIITGDWFMALAFAKYGKIKMLDDIMSVYRVNDGGIWSGAYKNQSKFLCKTATRRMLFYFCVYNIITDKDPAYFINETFEQYKKLIRTMKAEKEYKKYLKFIFRFLVPVYFNLLKILLKTAITKNKEFKLLSSCLN